MDFKFVWSFASITPFLACLDNTGEKRRLLSGKSPQNFLLEIDWGKKESRILIDSTPIQSLI